MERRSGVNNGASRKIPAINDKQPQADRVSGLDSTATGCNQKKLVQTRWLRERTRMKSQTRVEIMEEKEENEECTEYVFILCRCECAHERR